MSLRSVKGPKRANRRILWLWKVKKIFWPCDLGYHLSIKGRWKRYLFWPKWSIGGTGARPEGGASAYKILFSTSWDPYKVSWPVIFVGEWFEPVSLDFKLVPVLDKNSRLAIWKAHFLLFNDNNFLGEFAETEKPDEFFSEFPMIIPVYKRIYTRVNERNNIERFVERTANASDTKRS